MAFVGVAVQGMVLDSKGVAVGVDQATVEKHAEAAVKKLNDAMTGESEGYVAVVVEV